MLRGTFEIWGTGDKMLRGTFGPKREEVTGGFTYVLVRKRAS
jgi:hypothetical protein